MTNAARALLGLAVSLASLAYVLRDLDLGELWRLALGLNLWYVAAINALYFLSFLLRTLRWQIIMDQVRPGAPFGPLMSSNIIGYMANNVLPVRAGEVVRAVIAARLIRAPLAGSVASIVVERILDAPVIIGSLFLVVLFIEPGAQAGLFNRAYLVGAGAMLLAAYLGLSALLAALVRWPDQVSGFLTRLAGVFSARAARWLAEALDDFRQGLGTLSRTDRLASLIVLSVVMRVPLLAMHWVFLPAVGLPLSLMMACLATVGAGLATTIPSGPGYAGTYQLAMLWALQLAGAPAQAALAYGILYWAAQYFPLVIAGLIELYRQGLNLSNLNDNGRRTGGLPPTKGGLASCRAADQYDLEPMPEQSPKDPNEGQGQS